LKVNSNLTILAAFFICILQMPAQTNSIHNSPPLSEAAPKSVGMSGERLEKIDEMFKEAVNDAHIPGAVALIARDGKIVYHKAFGTADASGRELKKDDIFRIASQTKAITATAVMMLWEEGKFRLDDPISKFIPEFKDPEILKDFNEEDSTYTTIPAENEITIRQLLTHTSGLGYGMIDRDHRIRKIYQKAGVTDLFTTKSISIEESVKKLAELPLHNEPGEEYNYSGSLDVLGYLIEVISEKPLDRFYRERIFDPLGMNDTWFYLPEEKADRLVAVQTKKNNKWVNFPITFYDPDYPKKGALKFFSGGAGLSSTARDYATFLQMYLNGGELNGKRILSRTTVKTIMGNHANDLVGGDNEYHGVAFRVITPKGQDFGGQGSAGTFEGGGYFNSHYFADPQEQIIGILLKQTRGPIDDQTSWKFRQMLLSSIDD